MKLYIPHMKADKRPIKTDDEYRAERDQCEALRKRWESLRDRGGPEFHLLGQQDTRLFHDFRRCLPYVLNSKCPYCGTLTWKKAFVFSLQDEFWYLEYDNGREVYQDSLYPHLFCVDGALGLNGHEPTDALGIRNLNKRITMRLNYHL